MKPEYDPHNTFSSSLMKSKSMAHVGDKEMQKESKRRSILVLKTFNKKDKTLKVTFRANFRQCLIEEERARREVKLLR
jgi:hypothetical protein